MGDRKYVDTDTWPVGVPRVRSDNDRLRGGDGPNFANPSGYIRVCVT